MSDQSNFPRILCVDDEALVLKALKRTLVKNFDVTLAHSGKEALELIAKEKTFHIVLSDMLMPEMDGATLLKEIKSISPDSIRILLTGVADLETAMKAVNEGQIFRFLTKPYSSDSLTKTFQAAYKQYQLVVAERELLAKTLSGSIDVLAEILSLVSPTAFSRTSRIKRYIKHMTSSLKLEDTWRYEVAASLSQIGSVTLLPTIIQKVYSGQPLTTSEQEAFSSHPAIASTLISKIPRLGSISEIILNQNKPISSDISLAPDCESEYIAMGSQLLQIALGIDDKVIHGETVYGASHDLLKSNNHLNSKLLETFDSYDDLEKKVLLKSVYAEELTPAMILDEDVEATTGMLIAGKGQQATPMVKEKLVRLSRAESLKEPFRISVNC